MTIGQALTALITAGLIAAHPNPVRGQDVAPPAAFPGAFKLAAIPVPCWVERVANQGARSGAAASLSETEAWLAYSCAFSHMIAAYEKAGLGEAAAYGNWQNFARVPYVSATHGNRYVNNYANPTGAAYGRFEGLSELPVGSVLAKDSFGVTRDGQIAAGPLFLMEKMPAGFAPAAGNWRYAMVLPDGVVFGISGGPGDANVRFCQDCHDAVGPAQDHLYFLPERYRIEEEDAP